DGVERSATGRQSAAAGTAAGAAITAHLEREVAAAATAVAGLGRITLHHSAIQGDRAGRSVQSASGGGSPNSAGAPSVARTGMAAVASLAAQRLVGRNGSATLQRHRPLGAVNAAACGAPAIGPGRAGAALRGVLLDCHTGEDQLAPTVNGAAL